MATSDGRLIDGNVAEELGWMFSGMQAGLPARRGCWITSNVARELGAMFASVFGPEPAGAGGSFPHKVRHGFHQRLT